MMAHTVTRLQDGSIAIRQYPNIETQGHHVNELIIPADAAARVGAEMAYLALKPQAEKEPLDGR